MSYVQMVQQMCALAGLLLPPHMTGDGESAPRIEAGGPQVGSHM